MSRNSVIVVLSDVAIYHHIAIDNSSREAVGIAGPVSNSDHSPRSARCIASPASTAFNSLIVRVLYIQRHGGRGLGRL